MTLRVGTLDVVDVRYGAGAVARVMLGTEQVWPDGTATVTGTIASLEIDDVASIVGIVTPLITGAIAIVEADDLAAIVGTFSPPGIVTGAVAVVEVDDVAAIVGTVAAAVFTGTIVAVEDDDLAELVGTVTAPVFSGTIVAVEEDDFAAIVGAVAAPVYTGAIAVVEDDDVAAIAGTFTAPVFTGVILTTEDDDVAALAGTFTPLFTGTVAVTEADDVATIAGTFTPPLFTGVIAVTEAADVVVITGTFSAPTAWGDNFNRANGNLGAAWTHSTWVVASNQATKSSGNDYATFLQDVGSADMWVEADVTPNAGFGVINLRHPSGTDQATAYLGFWDPAGHFTIGKSLSGAYQDVNNPGGTTDVPTAPFKLRLEAQGTTLRLYVNGTLKMSGTDTSITTGRWAGLNAGTGPTFDNFRCGPLPYTP